VEKSVVKVAMEIVNLTPGPVTLLRDDAKGSVTGFTSVGSSEEKGSRFTIVAKYEPRGRIVWTKLREEPGGELKIKGRRVTLIRIMSSEPANLPAPTEGIYLLVTIDTAQAVKASGRTTRDLLIPFDAVHNPCGRTIGYRRFAIV